LAILALNGWLKKKTEVNEKKAESWNRASVRVRGRNLGNCKKRRASISTTVRVRLAKSKNCLFEKFLTKRQEREDKFRNTAKKDLVKLRN
jgi:hypothetical protein